MSMDHQQWLEQHDRMIADMNNTLRRAIRMGVQDARRQRKRNAEFDEKMTQIAAAQLVNEELLKQNEGLLKRFLERGGNGAAK
ncbi:MAG TPA: hypothetical protein VNM37_27230 [Candidatus Dormibacteraeota bacterium]|nr:hypothetical protein [Candidatus Dormibacteraeota bacterium]